jgi:hypothetical protein
MITALAFWALTIVCCSFALRFGGREARTLVAAYIIGCLATIAAHHLQHGWSHGSLPALIVDGVLFLALWRIALGSDRWYPIWFAGFQLVGVVTHLAAFLVPGFAYKAYFLLQSFWAVPMMLVLVIGPELDRRVGVRDEPDDREFALERRSTRPGKDRA